MNQNNIKQPIDLSKMDQIYFNALNREPAAISELVALSKKKSGREYLMDKPNQGQLRSMLRDENPKVRKNTARLIGSFALESDLDILLDALDSETTLYVIPSQILGIGACAKDTSAERQRKVSEKISATLKAAEELNAENEKSHALSIRQAANKVLSSLRSEIPTLKSEFNELNLQLTAIENCNKLLLSEAKEKGLKPQQTSSDALFFESIDYSSVFVLRSFSEALIPLGCTELPEYSSDKIDLWATNAAQQLSAFKTVLQEHYAPTPIPYRIEIRGVPHEKRGILIHALSEKLDADSTLQNSPSSYIAECRLDCSSKKTQLFAKLFQPADSRFSYRQESIPASISPVTAANLMRLIKPHCKNSARVLDLCCGSGTLLVERALMSPVSECLGVDISTSAVSIARKNFRAAEKNYPQIQKKLSVINGDLRKFRPRERFDELISNLPFGVRVGNSDGNDLIYRKLIERLDDCLTDDAFALLYTTQRSTLLRMTKQSAWSLVDEIRFEAGGLQPWGLVFKKR